MNAIADLHLDQLFGSNQGRVAERKPQIGSSKHHNRYQPYVKRTAVNDDYDKPLASQIDDDTPINQLFKTETKPQQKKVPEPASTVFSIRQSTALSGTSYSTIDGDTYKFKDLIRNHGGKWNHKTKEWMFFNRKQCLDCIEALNMQNMVKQ